MFEAFPVGIDGAGEHRRGVDTQRHPHITGKAIYLRSVNRR
jgi:hypothetical protein